MEFEYSKRTKEYTEQLTDFMNKHVYPNEKTFQDQLASQSPRWQIPAIMEDLKAKAKERGLWNLFLPESRRGAGLSNLDYAPLCEVMGRSPIAPEANSAVSSGCVARIKAAIPADMPRYCA